MDPACGRSLSLSKSLRTIGEGDAWSHLYSNPLQGNPWNSAPHQRERQTISYGMDSHGICCSNRGSPSSKTAMFAPASLGLKAPWPHRQHYWWSSSPIPNASCGTSRTSRNLLHDHCRHDQKEFPVGVTAQWKLSTLPRNGARQDMQIRSPRMAHCIPSPLCLPNIGGKCLDKVCALLRVLDVEWMPFQSDQTSQAMEHRLCTPSMPHSIAVLWSWCHHWTKIWSLEHEHPASCRMTQGYPSTTQWASRRRGSETGMYFPACWDWADHFRPHFEISATPFPASHGCWESWSASSCVHVLHLHERPQGWPCQEGCPDGRLHGLDGNTCNDPKKEKGSAACLEGSEPQPGAPSHHAPPSKSANQKNGHTEIVIWWAGPPWKFSPAVTAQISWTLHVLLSRFSSNWQLLRLSALCSCVSSPGPVWWHPGRRPWPKWKKVKSQKKCSI